MNSQSSRNVRVSLEARRTPSASSSSPLASSSSNNPDNDFLATTSVLRANLRARATASRKRAEYQARATSTAALAETKLRSLIQTHKTQKGGARKAKYRRPKRSAFCNEIKRIVESETAMSSSQAHGMAQLAQETMEECLKKLRGWGDEEEELRGPLLDMMAYFHTATFRVSAKIGSKKEDLWRDFECLRSVLEPLQALIYK
ncbi:hypothetical protein MPH_07375 [Macrophomina phaseolina MS6]|uniref:Uncharacterized protein n=1 Tax=Macrophomina phaseolina (strain MS6) TaxID=1126212 RepID=K2QZL3_MACPH|nr:hypothetical protein MPH_07375 [Macrophomina phaseolina MS6]